MNPSAMTYEQCIEEMVAEGPRYHEARDRLWSGGPGAVSALLLGLEARRPKTRQVCCAQIDHLGDAFEDRCFDAIVPLLEDPVARVRRTAVHTLACRRCHPLGDYDVVALLLPMLEDSQVSVRRTTARELAGWFSDPRVVAAVQRRRKTEPDAKVLQWIDTTLSRRRRDPSTS